MIVSYVYTVYFIFYGVLTNSAKVNTFFYFLLVLQCLNQQLLYH